MGFEGSELLGQWMIIGVFFLGGVYVVLEILKFFRPHPPLREQFITSDQFSSIKGEVEKIEEKFATSEQLTNVKEDVDELKQDVKNLDEKVDLKFKEESVAASNSRKELYNSINKIREDVSSLKTDNSNHGKQIGLISQKADTILKRLPPPPKDDS